VHRIIHLIFRAHRNKFYEFNNTYTHDREQLIESVRMMKTLLDQCDLDKVRNVLHTSRDMTIRPDIGVFIIKGKPYEYECIAY
jgi:hypothetical protein